MDMHSHHQPTALSTTSDASTDTAVPWPSWIAIGVGSFVGLLMIGVVITMTGYLFGSRSTERDPVVTLSASGWQP